jgi:hypothetical protein
MHAAHIAYRPRTLKHDHRSASWQTTGSYILAFCYILEKASAGRNVTLVRRSRASKCRKRRNKLKQAEGLSSSSVQLCREKRTCPDIPVGNALLRVLRRTMQMEYQACSRAGVVCVQLLTVSWSMEMSTDYLPKQCPGLKSRGYWHLRYSIIFASLSTVKLIRSQFVSYDISSQFADRCRSPMSSCRTGLVA